MNASVPPSCPVVPITSGFPATTHASVNSLVNE